MFKNLLIELMEKFYHTSLNSYANCGYQTNFSTALKDICTLEVNPGRQTRKTQALAEFAYECHARGDHFIVLGHNMDNTMDLFYRFKKLVEARPILHSSVSIDTLQHNFMTAYRITIPLVESMIPDDGRRLVVLIDEFKYASRIGEVNIYDSVSRLLERKYSKPPMIVFMGENK